MLEQYQSGETLFGREKTQYHTNHTVCGELLLLSQLYNGYGSVLDTMDKPRNINCMVVMGSIEKMRGSAERYEPKCTKAEQRSSWAFWKFCCSSRTGATADAAEPLDDCTLICNDKCF